MRDTHTERETHTFGELRMNKKRSKHSNIARVILSRLLEIEGGLEDGMLPRIRVVALLAVELGTQESKVTAWLDVLRRAGLIELEADIIKIRHEGLKQLPEGFL